MLKLAALFGLNPLPPIPIQEDPYFAGMAFEGTNATTGAFRAHRFEFKIKKTKLMSKYIW